MRSAFWFIAAAIVVLVVAIVFVQGGADSEGEQAASDFSDTIPGQAPESTRNGPAPPASNDQPVDAGLILAEPDRSLQAEPTTDSEEPPRTVAGLPAVKQSVELPVVDPASLQYDPEAGHLDLPEADEVADSGFMPGPQLVVDNDGPLGGVQPQPDSSVPGPAGISGDNLEGLSQPVSSTDEAANDTGLPGGLVLDSSGPGQRVDPAQADSVPPNFRVPDDDEIIEDPDSSYRPEDPQ